MSNHTHICQTDTTGDRAKFKQTFYGLVAKVTNKELNRRENVWSAHAPGDTVLLDTEKVGDTMVYIWLNPVAAGLVERVEHWDHFQILPKHWGKVMRFKCPDDFREGNPTLPEFIEFTPMPPPGFDHLPLEEVVAYFEKRIEAEEERYMIARRKKNKKVLGMEKCYDISPNANPAKSVSMFTRNPKFSSTFPERIVNAIEALRSFRRLYKKRLEGLKNNSKDLFPAGTIQIKNLLCIDCLPVWDDPHLRPYAPFELT